MTASAEIVTRLAHSDQPVYGVSTGFGSLANTPIPADRREELQRALVRSHAAGMGDPVEREVVRAMVFLRARSLALGFSGARPVVAETMLALLNAGITPVVYEHGSLGASGDLAPLAHAALALIGEGEVWDPDGNRRPAADVLAEAGIEPPVLTAKEGLALINGTDGILGMLVLALADLDVLVKTADIAAAMTVEALLGTDRAFSEELQACGRMPPGRRRPCGGCWPDHRSSPATATATRGAGRLLAALHAPGAQRRSRHRRARHRRGAIELARPSTTRWSCPTAGSSRAATSTARRSASSAISSPSPGGVGAIAERRTDLLDATRSQALRRS